MRGNRIFNFGVNATSEVASKLQKIANNEVQKETDEMFGRLHEDYIKEQEREDAAKKKLITTLTKMRNVSRNKNSVAVTIRTTMSVLLSPELSVQRIRLYTLHST